MSTRRRLTATLAAAVLSAAGLLAALGGSAPAVAIPTLAQSCATTSTTAAGGTGWQQLGSPVWVNLPAFRRTVINVSADADVSRGARIAIAYRIDPSGFIQNPGARWFATWSEFPQTRHSMVVMPVGAGWHRVFVFWAVVGPPATSGTVGGHCTTVEGTTA